MIALAIPFSIVNGALATTTNYDDIVRWQVLDAAATGEGERLMRPQWGLDIRNYLYRPSDHLEQQDAASVLRQRVAAGVPRATVTRVTVGPDPDLPNLVTIEIQYKSSRLTDAVSTVSLQSATVQGT